MNSPFKEAGEQQSPEWLAARCGKVTASRFKDVMAVLKNCKPGAARNTYLWEIVIERLTGQPAPHFTSAAMMHGTEFEPVARMAYEARTGRLVTECGFVHHPTIDDCGGSPDGLIDDDGGIEIKCPFNSANHLLCFLEGIPDEHIPQIQGLMAITGRDWWDFLSFDPRMPEHKQMYIERILRDDDYIGAMEDAILTFLTDVESMLYRLQSK